MKQLTEEAPEWLSDNSQTPSNIVALDKYLESLGRTRTTFWRWQRMGLVSSVNVLGRNYITRDEIRRFEAAAIRGDLSRGRATPSPAS